MTKDKGVFQCAECQIVYPITLDKVVTGLCGDCYK